MLAIQTKVRFLKILIPFGAKILGIYTIYKNVRRVVEPSKLPKCYLIILIRLVFVHFGCHSSDKIRFSQENFIWSILWTKLPLQTLWHRSSRINELTLRLRSYAKASYGVTYHIIKTWTNLLLASKVVITNQKTAFLWILHADWLKPPFVSPSTGMLVEILLKKLPFFAVDKSVYLKHIPL